MIGTIAIIVGNVLYGMAVIVFFILMGAWALETFKNICEYLKKDK